MSEWFIDRSGQMPLFLHDGRFISETGTMVGWLIGNCVYSLSGAHLGWLEGGILYDENNDIVAFSADAGHIPSASRLGSGPGVPHIPEPPTQMPGITDTPWRPLHGGRSNRTLEELFGEQL